MALLLVLTQGCSHCVLSEKIYLPSTEEIAIEFHELCPLPFFLWGGGGGDMNISWNCAWLSMPKQVELLITVYNNADKNSCLRELDSHFFY